MKAFALTSAETPASLIDLPIPDLAEDGVRIRVHAASINGFDVFQANGYLFAYMEHVFPTVIGRDFAGVVESVGAGRSDLAVGDEVFGFIPSTPPLHDGTYAEVIAGSAGLVLARKPAACHSRPPLRSPSSGPPRSAPSMEQTSGPETSCWSSGRPAAWARSPSSSPHRGGRP